MITSTCNCVLLATRRLSNGFVLLAVGILLTGCESLPHAQIDEANSLGDAHWRIELNASTQTSASVSRGFGENLDLGAQVDSLDETIFSAYAKYSLLNQSRGWSFAALLGGFDSDRYASGYFIGPVSSYRIDHFLFSIRARYNKLNNRVRDSEDFFPVNFPSDEIAQADLSIRAFMFEDRLSLKLSYGCSYLLGSFERASFYDNQRTCNPIVGVTLFTR